MKKPVFNLILILLGMLAVLVTQAQTVTSDKDDYAPRSTAVFTGADFWPNETITLKVKNLTQPCGTLAPDSSYLPWTVVANASGGFQSNWTVCNCPGDSLRLKATGMSSGLIAYAYFTDATNTEITFLTGPSSAAYGSTIPLIQVRLNERGNGGSLGPVVAGRLITFTINGVAIGSNTTNANGIAQISNVVVNFNAQTYTNNNGLRAAFGGDSKPNDIYNASNKSIDFTVIRAPLAISIGNQSKVYGNLADLSTTTYSSSGLLFGNVISSITFSSTGSPASAAVGSYPITGSAVVKSGSTDVSNNYNISYTPGTLSVSQRPLTVTATGVNRAYNGKLTATVTLGTNAVNGDIVNATSTSAIFASKDVGNNISISVSGISIPLTGVATNYSLTNTTASTSANITALPITGTFTVANKEYDKTNTATILTRALSGVISGDDVALTGGSTAFPSVTVGSKTLNLSGATLSGPDAGNYSLASVASTTASITPKPVTVSFTASNKVYDGTNTATVSAPSQIGVIAGDNVNIGLQSPVFLDMNVGVGKTVNATVNIGGGDKDQYSFPSTASSTASITARPITITANSTSKDFGTLLTFNGSEFSVAASTQTTGLVAGESIASVALTSMGSAIGAAPGNYPIVPTNAAAGAGTLITNYSPTYVNGTLTVVQTIIPITITADPATKIYGDADPALSYKITSGSLQNGDAITGVLARVAGEDAGTYGIQQGSLTAGSKYDITFVGADFEITVRPITVAADAKTKVYGESDPALTYQITSGSLTFSDAFSGSLSRETGEDVGSYAIEQGTLAVSANYNLSYVGEKLSITKRPVEITADAKTKVYGESDPALTYQITSGSLAFSDAFSGSLTRISGEAVGAYAIQQGTVSLSTNYDLSYVGANLSITKRPVTITADTKTKVYGESDPALTYQITSGSLAFSDAFSGSLSRISGEAVGAYAIQQGTVALSTNYDLSYVGANLSITKRPVTITADAKTKVYGESDPALTYQITSGSLAFSDAFSGSLSRIAGEAVGVYAIQQGTVALSTNYDLSYVGANLSITKRPITITADAKTKVYGDPDPALTFQVTSGNLAFSDTFSGVLSREGGEDVGLYNIWKNTVSAGPNYEMTFVSAKLEITKRSITITADNKSKFCGQSNPALSYQITGSLVSPTHLTGSLSRAAGESNGTYVIGQGTLALTSNYALIFVPGIQSYLSSTTVMHQITLLDRIMILQFRRPLLVQVQSQLQHQLLQQKSTRLRLPREQVAPLRSYTNRFTIPTVVS